MADMVLGEKTVREIIFILGAAILIAFIVNSLSPNGIALIGSWDIDDGVISARSKADVVVHDIEIQTVIEAKGIYDSKQAIFIDARDSSVYKKGSIKGAVSLSIYDYDELIEAFIARYPLEQKMVTYCSGRECDESHKLATFLKAEGYTDIRVFIDGFPAWEHDGLPVDK